jgi:pyrroline-5-carboxylate reductase
MERERIVFIGGGNMARSLIGGLVAGGWPAERIGVTDPSPDQRKRLESRFGVTASEDNRAAVADADVIVLAVKPQLMEQVCQDLSPALAGRQPLIVSIAAGVRMEAIARWLAYDGPVVRCMPNTPSLLQAGITALFPNDRVSEDQRSTAESILRAGGSVIWVDDEKLMDTVTGISGSGPAYFFRMMEAMEEAGVARGLPREQARLLVIETALGAARMALESEDDPGTLRQNVTSKGGTTAAALETFEAGGLAELVDRAVGAAAERAAELGDQLGGQ